MDIAVSYGQKRYISQRGRGELCNLSQIRRWMTADV